MLDARTASDATSPPPPTAMASPQGPPPPPPPPPPQAPPLPPLPRRRSSVSSATTVAEMRSAGFRARAAHSADEKRVTFRATPTVRYFKSTHTASFGSDSFDEYDHDDRADGDQSAHAQAPRWRAMRARRVRWQLKPVLVSQRALADVDAPTSQLVAKIAEAARQRAETAVRVVVDGGATASGSSWTKRGDARFRSPFRGQRDEKAQTWERRDAHAHEVVVRTTLPCKFRELQRVLETTRHDELDAALLACASERIERAALLESVETTTAELREQPRQKKNDTIWSDPETATTTITVKRVVLPRTAMAEATQVWRRVRQDNSSENGEEATQEFIDVTNMPPRVKSTNPPLLSRVLQQMASLSGADHALVGDMQVGFVVQPSHERSSQETSVAMFISRKRKLTKSFAWAASTVSDVLIARLGAISTVLWSYVERRRLGFQVLAYPDTVYCVDDIKEAEADVTHCPFCDNEFGYLRQRHFCHSCALWVCVKCSSDEDVETHHDGWTMEAVKMCLACQGRIEDCVFDYDRGNVCPAQQIVRSDPEAASFRSSRRLAESWIHRLQQSSDESDHKALTLVLDTLMTLLSGDECGFRLSGLEVDWEDLDPDEMVESVEELAEMLPIPFLSRRDCLLSHDSFRRQYVLVFNEETGIPQSPTTIDDADRVKRVEKLSLLESTSYPSLDALCALAATDLGCQMAFVTVVTTDRTVPIAMYGATVTQRDRDDGFCAYTLLSIHPLVVLDMARDIRSRYFSLTTDENARFYCGVPLFSPDETFVMATFALVDTRPREAIGTSDYSMFMAFARTARTLLMRELEERSLTPASGA